MKVEFVKSQDIAHNIKTFWFKPMQKFRFVPGQFTEVTLEHKNLDDRGVKRWFTISSPPFSELLGITTKFHDNISTFKQALLTLSPGEQIDFASPIGSFVLPKDSKIPIVFIAGGIGSTPFNSILENGADDYDITLYYGAQSDTEVAFADTFDKLGDKFIKIIGLRLDVSNILNNTKNPSQTYFYISGPKPMVEDLKTSLTDKNIPESHIFMDKFPGY